MRLLHAAHLGFLAVWTLLSVSVGTGCAPSTQAKAMPLLVVTDAESDPMVPTPDPAFAEKAKPAEVIETPETVIETSKEVIERPKTVIAEAEKVIAPEEAPKPCPCGCGRADCDCPKGKQLAEHVPLSAREIESNASVQHQDPSSTPLLKGKWHVEVYVSESCPHGQRWLGRKWDSKAKAWVPGKDDCPSYELQRLGYRVGVFPLPDGEACPMFKLASDGGQTKYYGYRATRFFVNVLGEARSYVAEESAPVAPAPEAAAAVLSAGDGPPIVHVHDGPYGGTGTIVWRDGDRYRVVTNWHTAMEGGPYRVSFNGTPPIAAVRLGYDRKHDLGLLEFRYAGDLTVCPISPADPGLGAAVVSHGYPWSGGFKERLLTIEGVKPDGLGDTLGYALAGDTFVSGESGSPLTHDGRLVGVVWGNSPTPDGKIVPETRGGAATYEELRSFLHRWNITPAKSEESATVENANGGPRAANDSLSLKVKTIGPSLAFNSRRYRHGGVLGRGFTVRSKA